MSSKQTKITESLTRKNKNVQNTKPKSNSSKKDESPKEIPNKSGKESTKKKYLNLSFYLGQCPSKPDGDTISVIHNEWGKDYNKLEMHHGFIQWLFPLYEGNGVNWHAKTLTKDEAKLMRENMTVGKNVMKSYEMMLGFYGMELANKTTGEGKN